MAIWPIIFVRKGCNVSESTLRHERTHFEQQKELLILPFYILYLIFWPFYGYRNIPFEREAYDNQNNKTYLETRKRYAWLKYFKWV